MNSAERTCRQSSNAPAIANMVCFSFNASGAARFRRCDSRSEKSRLSSSSAHEVEEALARVHTHSAMRQHQVRHIVSVDIVQADQLRRESARAEEDAAEQLPIASRMQVSLDAGSFPEK